MSFYRRGKIAEAACINDTDAPAHKAGFDVVLTAGVQEQLSSLPIHSALLSSVFALLGLL